MILKSVTRGGQLNLHSLRMLRQVVTTGLLVSFFIGIGSFGYQIWNKVPKYAWDQYFQYHKASILLAFNSSSRAEKLIINFSEPNGKLHRRYAADIMRDPRILLIQQRISHVVFQSAKLSLNISFGVVCLLLTFWALRGLFVHNKKHQRGSHLISPRALARRLRWTFQASDLRLDNVPLVKNKEMSHILITGTTGSGKTNAFHTLLPQIRRRGNRAIVVDLTGDLVAKYYREGKDLILNPFDARSVQWDLWKDCKSHTHYDALAESIIPDKGGSHDAFWDEAGRTLFRIAAQKLEQQDLRDPYQLYSLLTSSDMRTFQSFFEGTEASSYTNKDGEKTTLSVRANLATHLSGFKFLSPVEEGFSVRTWISQSKSDDQWLFLTAMPDQRKTLRPLISAWLDLSINALMSEAPDPKRRLWFITDELPALQKLPSLKTGLAELRKYGGCVLAGIQSIPQLEEIYGKAASQNMLNLFNTFLFFRNNDPSTTLWISKVLGECEQKETQENLSYGAHAMRDGVSINQMTKTSPLIIPTEIGALKDLEAYLKLPGGFPIVKMRMRYKSIFSIASVFVLNKKFSLINIEFEKRAQKIRQTGLCVKKTKTRKKSIEEVA
ncbi:type IV conjugative transfer system coupling protein TraD [Candidatus Nucleicultrix amoebiphila]|uniref:type IV conjugative transfer system coupling protein TraD n=1 Tax=Candidatus Nucleicultrix amoebiphila TaxID=1509244 RepID=UPI000A269B55|nr:type IV conjugative transfer system coupling protein TraD [Candidatus Nucleicultrix amoebiphila]